MLIHRPLRYLSLLLLTTVATAALAQDPGTPEAPALGCDTTNIDWVLPGHFDEALERARDEGRMLLIKGISFGVDDVGATCATKGRW